MEQLLKKQLPPPFVPKITDQLDTSNFDSGDALPTANKEHDWHIDSKYEPLWESEFGAGAV